MKIKYTNFLDEVATFQSKNKYNILSIVLFIIIITILLLKTEILYSVEHYTAPQEPKIDYTREISTSTMDFIKLFEGFKEKPYKDGNRESIGYGTKAREGQTITKEQAELEMKEHILKDIEYIEKKEKIGWNILNEKQQTALLSLSYNIGADKVASLVRKNINKPLTETDFTQYWCSGDKCIDGLKNRRLEEWNLYKNY